MASEKLYDIWLRNYPRLDINLMEEWDLNHGEPMKLEEAKQWIAESEQHYADENWRGHELYKAKFYPEEYGKWD